MIILLKDQLPTTPAIPVTDAECLAFLPAMQETIAENAGKIAGLAAPQIGENIRFICVVLAGKPRYFIDPVVRAVGRATFTFTEGCFSVPGRVFNIQRPMVCRVSAREIIGDKIVPFTHEYNCMVGSNEKKFRAARDIAVWCHETDHLDCITIMDKWVMQNPPKEKVPA